MSCALALLTSFSIANPANKKLPVVVSSVPTKAFLLRRTPLFFSKKIALYLLKSLFYPQGKHVTGFLRMSQ